MSHNRENVKEITPLAAIPSDQANKPDDVFDRAGDDIRSGLVADEREEQLDAFDSDTRLKVETELVAARSETVSEYEAYFDFGSGEFVTSTLRDGRVVTAEKPSGRVSLDAWKALADKPLVSLSADEWKAILDAAGVVVPEAEESSPEQFVINDALFIGGDLPQSVLELPLKIGFGRSAQDKKWPGKPLPFSALVNLLSKHEMGEKDGKAFIQGTAIGNERKAKAMEQMCIVGLDLDSGIFPEPIAEKIQNELKLTSIIYTTHSHDGAETHVVQNSYAMWARKNHVDETPSTDLMRRYMRTAKKWEQWIVDTIQLQDEPIHTKDGISYVLLHQPMPKFRVIFPLSEPYVIAKQRLSQADAIKLWKGRLLGLAKILGVAIDESCLDPSRLFYLPRHKDGRAFKVIVTSGAALDFAGIPEIMPRSNERPDDDVFARAAKELGATGPSHMIGEFNLKQWAAKVADSFDIVELFRQQAENKIRTDYNTEKLEIECPFDYEHSNAGDAEDRGAWVQSAHADNTDSGFQWGCRHNCCSQRRRLDFVAEAIGHGWFTTEDISSDKYRIFTVEDKPDPDKLVETALSELDSIPRDSKSAVTVAGMLKTLATNGVETAQCRIVGDAASDRKLITRPVVTELVKGLKRAVAKAKLEQEGKESGRVQILNSEDHSVAVKKAVTAWTTHNTKAPRVFRGIDGLVRVETNAVTNLPHLASLTAPKLRHEMRSAIYYVNDDKSREDPIHNEIVTDILEHTNLDVPVLQGIVTTPFFTKAKDGTITLVSTPGYHAASQYLYSPSAGLKVPTVPNEPTADDVARALKPIMQDVYPNFPFDDQASLAHVLCMLLQPFMRNLIDGPTPVYFVSKPAPETGAGLLISTTMLIAHGAPGEARTEQASEEERRKGLLSALKSAASYFWLDNIKATIDSPAYASAITSGYVTGRILGITGDGRFPVRLQWIFAGNNPDGSGEMIRRCVPIFMDAKVDPSKRDKSKFVHPDLEIWVRENRSYLVWACLTLIQAWVAAGAPLDKSQVLGSFEEWSRIMGGLLKFLGVEGFLMNLDKLKETADVELDGYGKLATIWIQRWGLDMRRPVGNPDPECDGEWDDENSLVALIDKHSIPIKVGGFKGNGRAMSLGRELKKKKNAVIHAMIDGEMCDVLLRVGQDASNSTVYWFERCQQ